MKRLCILILLLLPIVSFSQGYLLKVNVKDLPAKKVFLANFYGEKNTIIDTANVDKEGNFEFKLKKNLPVGMYRIKLDKDNFFDFIFNKENIELKTNYYSITEDLEVNVSKENSIYFEFLKKDKESQIKLELLIPMIDYYPKEDNFYTEFVKEFQQEQNDKKKYIEKIIKENESTFVSRVIRTYQTPIIETNLNETARMVFMKVHYFDFVDFSDTTLLRTNIYTNKAVNYLSLYGNPQFTKEQLEKVYIPAVDIILAKATENKKVYNFILEYIVNGFEKFHFEKVLDHISDNYSSIETCENEQRKSELQKRLENYQRLTVGKDAPEIQTMDNKGNKVQLSKINSEYTLILFWATWCPHCKEILPVINKIYQAQTKKNLEILTISLDTSKTDWTNYLGKLNFNWIDCCDFNGWNTKSADDYNIYATPTMFLLDREKKILAKPITINELRTAVNNVGIDVK